MAYIVIEKPSTLMMLNESVPRSIEELRAQHPGKWLFIEATAFDEGDAVEGRLIAITDDEIDLADLSSDAAQRNTPVLVLHANYDEPMTELPGYAQKLAPIPPQ